MHRLIIGALIEQNTEFYIDLQYSRLIPLENKNNYADDNLNKSEKAITVCESHCTLLEKEKMLFTSIFSFYDKVFKWLVLSML